MTDVSGHVETQVTRYTVSVLPEEDPEYATFAVTVEYRGAGRWAVCRGRHCLSATGTWDWEPPGARGDGWGAAHSHPLPAALELATRHAPEVTAGGMTAARARELRRTARPRS